MLDRNNGKIIVIGGCPASGKTYTASLLGSQLNIPVVSKDFFKESLFDSLGFKDRQFSVVIGRASYELLLKTANLLSQQQYSFIIENSFFSGSEEHILASLNNQNIIQVWCFAPVHVLLERFIKRAKDGSRHPGHSDSNNIEETKKKILANTYVPLQLAAPLIAVPTTNFNSLDYINAINAVIDEYINLTK